jgi:hypothetical protein
MKLNNMSTVLLLTTVIKSFIQFLTLHNHAIVILLMGLYTQLCLSDEY